MKLKETLKSISDKSIPILDGSIPLDTYFPIDLSSKNPELKLVDITDPVNCQKYIDRILQRNSAKVAYGGYLEERNLYKNKPSFRRIGELPRNIHLGMDFWCNAGTKVLVPIEGKVHSFQNNDTQGDYGPTIVLEHRMDSITFHSLYGHLSIQSLHGLSIGQQFRQGEVLATLGTPDINVNYAPHLHFQLIVDMEGKHGDYPGVSTKTDLKKYRQNCPDPNLLLKIYQ